MCQALHYNIVAAQLATHTEYKPGPIYLHDTRLCRGLAHCYGIVHSSLSTWRYVCFQVCFVPQDALDKLRCHIL